MLLLTIRKPAELAGHPRLGVLEHNHHLMLEDQGHRFRDSERDHEDLHQFDSVEKDLQRHIRDYLLPLRYRAY